MSTTAEDDQYSQLTLIGDWSCSQCTLKNTPGTVSCSACGASRSLDDTSLRVVHQPEEGVVEFQPKPGSSVISMLTGNRELLWTCPRCTCKNDEDHCLCQACGFRAINVLDEDTVKSPEPSAQSESIASSLGNMIKKTFTSSEKPLPERENGDVKDRLWTCPHCTFDNHHDLLYCEQCRHTPGTEDMPMIPNDYLKPVSTKSANKPKAPPPRPSYQPERKKPVRPEIPPERPKQVPVTRSVSISRTRTASKPTRPPPPRGVTKSLSFQSPKTKPPPKPPRTDVGIPTPPLRSKQMSNSDKRVKNSLPISSRGDEEEHTTGPIAAGLSQSPIPNPKLSPSITPRSIQPRPTPPKPVLNTKPVPSSSSPRSVPRSSPGSSPKPIPRTTPRPVPIPRPSRNIPPKPAPRTGSHPIQQPRKDEISKPKEPVSITSVLFPNSTGSLSKRDTPSCTNNLDIIYTSSSSDEDTHCNEMTSPTTRHQTTPISPPRYQTVEELQQIEDSRCMGVWYDIVEHHKNKKGSFIDPEFSPSNSSLYLIPSKPITRDGKTITNWARPNDIQNAEGSGRWCVLRNHKTADIAQGMLGNCWFLSAVAVVAECPGVIENIIVTKEWCPEGVYQIRLFKDGQWRIYIVDDYFPTYNGHLVFAQVRRKQLWVPLIEKAFAKMHGCYEAIEGGQIIEGLHALTGYPCEKFQLRGDNDSDIHDTDFEYLWMRLLSFKEANYPMAAGTVSNSATLMGFNRANLEPNHAYSILDFKQEGQERKVRLRNPWGYDEVNNSGRSIWGRTTPYKGDGTFWIDVWEFYKFFKEIDICYYIPDWHCVRTRVSLPPYASSHQLVFHFHVFDETQVTICINQPSERRSNIAHQKNYKDLSVLVVRLPPMGEDTPTGSLPLPVECVATSQSHQLPAVTCNTFLSPGRYTILPLSFKGWYQNSSPPPSCELHDSPHLMAVFSSKVLECNENVPTVPGFARESLFLSAKKNGKLIQSSYNVKIYSLQLVPSLFMIMCENYNDSSHVDLICNCDGSKNVSSSRNNLQCHDVLPPRHKQILLVLARRVYTEPFRYSFSVNFQISPTNTRGGWGAMCDPPLDKVNSELHQAYPIQQGETLKISNRHDRNQVPPVDCRIS